MPSSRNDRAPASVRPAPNVDLPSQRYLNRELSALKFQERVLEEAEDASNPLLERVKFLAIVGNNLDEFFMVRVGGLKMQIEAGVYERSIDGLSPAEQLTKIRAVAQVLMERMRACWRRSLQPALAEHGVRVLDYADLSSGQRQAAETHFKKVVFPVLTPLALDPGRPFPFISNLSLNLAVMVRDRLGGEHFARVKIPSTLPRLVALPPTGRRPKEPAGNTFVWLEQVVTAGLAALFPGLDIVEAHPFRVTRNADLVIQELEAADLLATIEESLRQRRFGAVVRLSLDGAMPAHLCDLLSSHMELDPSDVYTVGEPLGIGSLLELAALDRFELKDPPYLPVVPPPFEAGDVAPDLFAAVRRGDVLLHHPYDSFSPVVDLLEAAAADPQVLAIKQTLYRVGGNSPVVGALLAAAQNGKQVAVLVELKARFDEESNINWARALEREGVHVVYGLLGLKTHSKVLLVVRREGDELRRYVHLATGNYNPFTAARYTDLGLFTTDEAIGADVTDLFNFLTGYSMKEDYRKLLVAPINLRARLEALIRREMAHAEAGRGGRLIFQMNALVDPEMIELLYAASRAGVEIDLIVRGVCCLRPGVAGLSDRIRVRSVVGRFLEHARIYYFGHGGEESVYLGSADLMPRNMDRRIEVLFPIEASRLVRRIRDEILQAMLDDNTHARLMEPDGTYRRARPGDGEISFVAQAWLMARRASRPASPRRPGRRPDKKGSSGARHRR